MSSQPLVSLVRPSILVNKEMKKEMLEELYTLLIFKECKESGKKDLKLVLKYGMPQLSKKNLTCSPFKSH